MRYLLGRGYPRLGALGFVGNRYQLPKSRREVLGRGVYPGEEALARANKLLGADKLQGRALGVDGHNVLITLESAILGRELIACDDGVIRDAAWVSNSYRPSEATDQALDLIFDFIYDQGCLSVVFFLFAPMSMSGEMAAHIRALISGRDMMGRAEAVPVPSRELVAFPGVTATSSSVLIDRVAEPVDLAGLIVRARPAQAPLTALRAKEAADAGPWI